MALIWSTPELKQYNKERIRRAIQCSEKSTKLSVSKTTSLSVATCNTLINEMLQAQEIIRVDQEELMMGRPADLFAYNREYHHVVGMHISSGNGNNLAEVSVTDALGDILMQEEHRTGVLEYDTLECLISELIDADPKIDSIAIGISGVTHKGTDEACDMLTLTSTDIAEKLRQKFDVCVEVRNIMDFLAYGIYHSSRRNGENPAEFCHNSRGSGENPAEFHHNSRMSGKNLAVVHFTEEKEGHADCGFIVNERVLHGHTGFAGELDYIIKGLDIDRKQQARDQRRREGFLQYVTRIILIIITTINPAEIVIMGGGITDAELEQIRADCEKIVTNQHIPQVVVGQDYAACCRKGLVTAALNRKQYPLSKPI